MMNDEQQHHQAPSPQPQFTAVPPLIVPPPPPQLLPPPPPPTPPTLTATTLSTSTLMNSSTSHNNNNNNQQHTSPIMFNHHQPQPEALLDFRSIEQELQSSTLQSIEKLKRALAVNKQYQTLLDQQLNHIEGAQQRNRSLQRRLRTMLMDKKTASNDAIDSTSAKLRSSKPINSKKYMNIMQKRPASRYFFQDRDGTYPPPNSDTLQKRVHQEKMPLVYRNKKWTNVEIKNLKSGVRQQLQQKMMAKVMNQFQNESENNNNAGGGGGGGSSSSNNASSSSDAISRLHAESKRIEKMTDQQLEMAEYKQDPDAARNLQRIFVEIETNGANREDLLHIDWKSLCTEFLPSNRTPDEAKKYWLSTLTCKVKADKWTRDEDRLILALAQQHKGHNWIQVAKELHEKKLQSPNFVDDGTYRTPLHCFRRYQRSLNVNMMRSKWSAEEDRALTLAVQQYGEKNWQQVANCLEGRAGQQCLHRWMKTLSPFIKRGRWTMEEDKRLIMGVHAYGKSWITIHEHIPGRTDVQCRERWCNILNPEVNAGPWTPEEDDRLRRAIAEYGLGKWSKISELCKPRTDNQCWRRWKVLNSEKEVREYKKTLMKRQNGLVRNFVGREKERSLLTEDDFEIDEGRPMMTMTSGDALDDQDLHAAEHDDDDEVGGTMVGDNDGGDDDDEEDIYDDSDDDNESSSRKRKRRKLDNNNSKSSSNNEPRKGTKRKTAIATAATTTAPNTKTTTAREPDATPLPASAAAAATEAKEKKKRGPKKGSVRAPVRRTKSHTYRFPVHPYARSLISYPAIKPLLPMLKLELYRQKQFHELTQSKPMLIGVQPSPFVYKAISLLQLSHTKGRQIPFDKDSKVAFVDPLIVTPDLTELPCMNVSRVTISALAALHDEVFGEEYAIVDAQQRHPGHYLAMNGSQQQQQPQQQVQHPLQQYQMEQEQARSNESMPMMTSATPSLSMQQPVVTTLGTPLLSSSSSSTTPTLSSSPSAPAPSTSLSVAANETVLDSATRVATAHDTAPPTQQQHVPSDIIQQKGRPRFGVTHLEYMDPDILQTEQFRTLTSVFNSLFQHSLYRVMYTASSMQKPQRLVVPELTTHLQHLVSPEDKPPLNTILARPHIGLYSIYRNNPEPFEVLFDTPPQPQQRKVVATATTTTPVASSTTATTTAMAAAAAAATTGGDLILQPQLQQQAPRKRGRPRKHPLPDPSPLSTQQQPTGGEECTTTADESTGDRSTEPPKKRRRRTTATTTTATGTATLSTTATTTDSNMTIDSSQHQT